MILWTIQERQVYKQILKTGIYRCDLDKSVMKDLKKQYDWLVRQMIRRVGKKPAGVTYPVWAWYQKNGQRKRPDLRRERWRCGWKGEHYVCLEIDIPDEEVLLSDFNAWSLILSDVLISYSEEEDEALYMEYNSLSFDEKRCMKDKNWERVFDLSPFENDWMRRGDTIQATFWELRREQIRAVRCFEAATPKPFC